MTGRQICEAKVEKLLAFKLMWPEEGTYSYFPFCNEIFLGPSHIMTEPCFRNGTFWCIESSCEGTHDKRGYRREGRLLSQLWLFPLHTRLSVCAEGSAWTLFPNLIMSPLFYLSAYQLSRSIHHRNVIHTRTHTPLHTTAVCLVFLFFEAIYYRVSPTDTLATY